MADRLGKPTRCEYHLFLWICIIGLAAQVWLLASEFTRSTLALIMQSFEDNHILPAVTICTHWKYSLNESEWHNFAAYVLGNPTYRRTFGLTNTTGMNRVDILKFKSYQSCLKVFEAVKSENK